MHQHFQAWHITAVSTPHRTPPSACQHGHPNLVAFRSTGACKNISSGTHTSASYSSRCSSNHISTRGRERLVCRTSSESPLSILLVSMDMQIRRYQLLHAAHRLPADDHYHPQGLIALTITPLCACIYLGDTQPFGHLWGCTETVHGLDLKTQFSDGLCCPTCVLWGALSN